MFSFNNLYKILILFFLGLITRLLFKNSAEFLSCLFIFIPLFSLYDYYGLPVELPISKNNNFKVPSVFYTEGDKKTGSKDYKPYNPIQQEGVSANFYQYNWSSDINKNDSNFSSFFNKYRTSLHLSDQQFREFKQKMALELAQGKNIKEVLDILPNDVRNFYQMFLIQKFYNKPCNVANFSDNIFGNTSASGDFIYYPKRS